MNNKPIYTIGYTPGDWLYNPKTGQVYTHDDNSKDSFTIANITWYDAPYALEWEQSIFNGRLICTAPDMCEMLEDIIKNGLTLEKCVMINDMLNFIHGEDLPFDENGFIDTDRFPENLLPDTRD